MPKPLGVVHVLIAGETPEHRLPQHPDKRMPAVLAGAGVGEHLARHVGQPERVVEFSIGEQSGVGSDDRSAKLQHQAAVEIDPENASPFDSPAGFVMSASLKEA